MSVAAPARSDAPVAVPRPSSVAFVGAGASAAARTQRTAVVAAFTAGFVDLTGWLAAPLPERLAAPVGVRAFVAWSALSATVAIDASYVAASRSAWGYHAALVHPQIAASFHATAKGLGYTTKESSRQWATLAKLAAIAGLGPDQLHPDRFDVVRTELIAAIAARHDGHAPNTVTTPLHGLEATLSALRVLDEPRRKTARPATRAGHWDTLAHTAPVLTTTMRRYLTQIALSLRPGSVALIDTSLRHLATYLADHHGDVSAVTDIHRTHIEGFKAWLTARPGYRNRREPAKTTIGMRMSHLRGFFDRIIEWGYQDAPARNPVFAGDMPLRDRPLPRFLDDPAAAALLAATRKLPQLFDRVCVEVLARTGLRKGEFLGLSIDAVVQIGDGYWLRTPVGKLRTDRYIPFHPKVRTLLQEWSAHRGTLTNTELMFVDRGRPIPQTRVDAAVRRAATAAGLGHVTPHQLRHTLATQAINRGMSLEAIAALLGHRSMTMTMTYARIADRTVADEYFAVSEKVEALYEPAPLPAEAEGPNMRKLRTETNRRLLGNGYCSRPEELGCRYETICESCSFFATTIAFRATLQDQHNDAHTHGETHRQDVYANILKRLDKPAS